jgi:phage baseplate assembly protein W
MATYGDPLIGVDLKLDSDLQADTKGDLMLVGQSNSADNVWQAVWLRIITTLGTYLFADNYGTQAREMVDEPITASMLSTLKSQIRDTISSDPRVASLTKLTVEQDTDTLSHIKVGFGIITINNQSIYNSGTL